MSVRVQIPGPLRALAGGAAEIQVQAETVAGLVDALQSAHAGFRDRLLDESGRLRSYVRVFVNEDDVRSLKGEGTPLRDGDVVAIVPAIAGGAGCCCPHRAVPPRRSP
jgi:molybdopterin synthase sulfur carrier subunit